MDRTGIKLSELQDRLEKDDIAPNLRAGATQLVFGAGNPNANILFVGEAPGRQEDEQGIPFVGASGKFLNEMLAAANLRRDDVYITNIVKYRPPSNRDPSPEEKRVFWPYLMQQIEIIAPKIVITLGRHSGECFIPDIHISRDHGQARNVTYRGYEFTVVPLYHPAAALYNGAMRQTLIEDFKQAVAIARMLDEK